MAYSKFTQPKNCTIKTGDWYGVAGLELSNPDLTRIGGDISNHADLPVQSLIRGCVVNDNGSVNYYLKLDDWSKKEDNTASNLDGTDGQVMVEIPEHYYLDWTDSEVQKSAISLSNLSGFNKFNKSYIGAYSATAYRPSKKLSSVKNNGVDYRGGNNNASWDAQDNTLLGKALSNLPIQALPANVGEDYRTYAQNRGSIWHPLTWKTHTAVQRLFMIEYATKNSQKAVDLTLTPEGYKKGGIGMGVTTVNQTELETFNNRYPFVPIGHSDSLANGSGEVNYTTLFNTPENVKVCRYRGIENLHGNIHELVEGLVAKFDHDNRRIAVYMINNPDDFTCNDETKGTLIGYIDEQSGNIKTIQNNTFLPIDTTGLATYETYLCDRGHFTLANESFEYLHVRTKGYPYSSVNSNSAGLFWIKIEDTFSLTFNYIGTRLCCHPNGY